MVLQTERPLIGREDQLARVRELLTAGAGMLVFEGPPGAGKTALLAAAGKLAGAAGLPVASARAHPLKGDFTFGVVRQLFEPLLAAQPEEERAVALSGLAAPAGQVIGGNAEHDNDVGDTFAVVHALYWLTARLAERRPLVLAIDDVQWADTATLRWLLYLARRAEGLPVVLLACRNVAEPGADPGLLAELADALAGVEVPWLTTGQAAELMTGVFGRSPDPGFSAACHRATAGNPFLLGELAASLAAQGLTPTAEVADRVPDLVPETVSAWVSARIRADSATAELAKAVAVLGDGTDLATAAALADLPLDRAGAAADALAALRFLAGTHPLEFVHSIVRNAVLSGIAPDEREAAHRRAARLLHERRRPDEQIAAQLLASGPTGQPWAVDALRAAADTAMRRSGPEAAVTYLRRALEEPAPGALEVDLFAQLGQAELAVDAPSAVAHLSEAFDKAGDPRRAARIASGLAVAITQCGEFARAEKVLAHAMAGLGPGEHELIMELEATSMMIGLAAFAPPMAARARRLFATATSPEIVRWAAASLAIYGAWAGGSCAEVVAMAERTLELEAGHDQLSLVATGLAAAASCYAGRFDLADASGDRILELARATGIPTIAKWAHWTFGFVAYQKGHVTDTIEQMRIADEISESVNGEGNHPDVYAGFAESYVDQGRPDEADAVLARFGFLDGDVPESTGASALFGVRGRIRLLRGDPRGALEDQLRSGRILEGLGIGSPALSAWRSRAAVIHHRLGEPAEATRLAGAELELSRAWGVPRPLGIALRAHGIIHDDLDTLAESAEVLAGSPARLEHARSRFRLGLALHARGHAEDARAQLRQAYRLARECGADALVERAGEAITRAGGRRPRAARTGAGALTPRQRRIAELAAAGRTNRQIAEEHYLTLRTVEHHLTGVYQVLGIDRREELAAALAAGES
ncbi:AAA family ATPase [Amycolatopsis sp. NPDC059027]|uniref:AAA family ATPase n=1 Tax=Amycolatopsis sp. NPDC059027 TaxID=3346709 RepID=UPI00366CC37B